MHILKGTFLSQIELHSVSLMSTHEKLLELQKADREWVKLPTTCKTSLYICSIQTEAVFLSFYINNVFII